MHCRSDDGRTVLDGTAGLWCCNAGYGRHAIAQAVERQLATLDFAPSFQMGHPIVFAFAERLASIASGGPSAGLDRVFFTGSGSESVNTALKIAVAYAFDIGDARRAFERTWTAERYAALTDILAALPVGWRHYAKRRIFAAVRAGLHAENGVPGQMERPRQELHAGMA